MQSIKQMFLLISKLPRSTQFCKRGNTSVSKLAFSCFAVTSALGAIKAPLQRKWDAVLSLLHTRQKHVMKMRRKTVHEKRWQADLTFSGRNILHKPRWFSNNFDLQPTCFSKQVVYREQCQCIYVYFIPNTFSGNNTLSKTVFLVFSAFLCHIHWAIIIIVVVRAEPDLGWAPLCSCV